jgi:hypothetical protein
MRNEHAVPFAQFRTGAVIEFEVFPGKPSQGTIKHLVAYGARNMLAVLSRQIQHDGTTLENINPATGSELAINLSHATRVISHSDGDVVFGEMLNERLMADAVELRASKGYARRGKRVVLSWGELSPQTAFQILLQEHVMLKREDLGVQPWEVVNLEALLEALKNQGIVRYEMHADHCFFANRAKFSAEKLARFVRQNINRFKVNLDAEAKAREQFEEQMYREEMLNEFRDGRILSDCDDTDDVTEPEAAVAQ